MGSSHTVEFSDGKTQRYLVSHIGRLWGLPRKFVITKEDETVGFWMDTCATYKCLIDAYWDGKWITKYGSFLADENDIAFVDWVREEQKQ